MRYALCISLGVRYNAARKGNENDNTFIIIYYDFVQETDKTISFGLFFFSSFFRFDFFTFDSLSLLNVNRICVYLITVNYCVYCVFTLTHGLENATDLQALIFV